MTPTKNELRATDSFLGACSRGDCTVVRPFGYAVVRDGMAEGMAHEGAFSLVVPDRAGDPAGWWTTVQMLAATVLENWNP